MLPGMSEQSVVRALGALVHGDVDLARREVAGGGSRLAARGWRGPWPST